MSKNRKPFKESKVGMFLKEKFPKIIDIVGDALPNRGLIGIVKNLISKDDSQGYEVSAEALRMLQDYELTELKEVTTRWDNDMTSDSWLSKNVRPITLLYLLLIMTVLVIGDSIPGGFIVKDIWVTLVESLLITVIIAYFGSRGVEKYKKISNK